MLKRLRKRNISIITILLIYFISVSLPILLVTGYLQIQGTNAIKKQIETTVNNQIVSYLNDLETELESIIILNFQLATDKSLRKMAVMGDYLNDIERTELYIDVFERISAIWQSSPYIEDVSVFIPAQDTLITATESPGFFIGENGLMVTRDRMRFQTQFPEEASDPLFYIVTNLSRDRFQSAVANFVDYDGAGAFLTDADGILTVATNPAQAQQLLDAMDDSYSPGGAFAQTLDTTKYFVVSNISANMKITLYSYMPYNVVFKSLFNVRNAYVLFTLILASLLLIFVFGIYRSIHKPILTLASAFQTVQNGNLDVSINYEGNNEFSKLFRQFSTMVSRIKRLIDVNYRQEMMVQQSELKQLQSQINPHFIYNSYFTLHRMILLDEMENAAIFSKKLGELFRYITRTATSQVTLEEEGAHAKAYADVQSVRFRQRMEIDFGAIPETMKQRIVPRLIVQPLIENAIEHGHSDTEQKELIVVRFYEENGAAVICVEDNGGNLTDEQLQELSKELEDASHQRETTALINIHRRIAIMFDPPSGVYLSRGKLGGLRVELRLVGEPKEILTDMAVGSDV